MQACRGVNADPVVRPANRDRARQRGGFARHEDSATKGRSRRLRRAAGANAAHARSGAGPTTAARIAVHVHGVAGESLGDGPGPIALDVAEALPRVMSTLVEDPSHPRWPSWRRG